MANRLTAINAYRPKINLSKTVQLRELPARPGVDYIADRTGLNKGEIQMADKIEVDMEMHDRLIVATALYFDAPLITKDRLIKDSGICSTIW